MSKLNSAKIRDASLLTDKCLIGGRWMAAKDGNVIAVSNPANDTLLANVPNFGAAETRQAIEAANIALPDWRAKLARERATILRQWYDLIIENLDDLATILTLEQGKPLTEARGEIAYAASFIEWFGEEAKRIYGETIPAHRADSRLIVLKQPIGVAAAITPWNFPAAMITRKAGPALAAGCTMVVKPASQTPLTALALAVLAERAGVPAGVFNVVTGSARAIGAELTANPLVRKLSFTGSTEVGKLLMAQASTTVKKLSLELGGNAPFIVFDDADIPAAVEGAIASKFRNSGQTCVCVNRFLADEKIAAEFGERLTEAVRKLAVGDGLAEGTQQGPLIDMAAIAKVEEHVADAIEHGASVLTGGHCHPLGHTFFEPTVITGCTPDMKIAGEETFGPVAAIFPFKTEAEAIELANQTEVGLSSYFYARDIGRVWRVAEALETGMVGVNTGLISTEVAPFGGIKESGLGREGSHHGIEEYLEIKYICMAGI